MELGRSLEAGSTAGVTIPVAGLAEEEEVEAATTRWKRGGNLKLKGEKAREEKN